MPSTELSERIGRLVAELVRRGNIETPTADDFNRWASLKTSELHHRIVSTRESLSPLAESTFFLRLMQWSLTHAPAPFGLAGTTTLLERRVKRILDSLDGERFLRVEGDQGDRDCLVLFGRFVPIGVYHADVGFVPRSVIARLSLTETIRVVRYLAVEMRGFGPTIGIHLPKLSGRRLTEEDFVEAHIEAAGLFEHNPALRGFFNSAWYYDPVVARISPHLAFLSRFANQHGALGVCLGSDADSIADATWKSPTRRRLYREGVYVPKRYARLWSRRLFFAWARETKGVAFDDP